MIGEENGGCQRCIDRQGVGDPDRHDQLLSATYLTSRGIGALLVVEWSPGSSTVVGRNRPSGARVLAGFSVFRQES